jgi:DNA-directed RNA polymerase specialized sigma24 family protein
VGRVPPVLDQAVTRGRATGRRAHTFEETVNFALDMEGCLARLNALDRCLLNRIVVQEYTVAEVSIMLRVSINTVMARLGEATGGGLEFC